jgi:hypothetical protein
VFGVTRFYGTVYLKIFLSGKKSIRRAIFSIFRHKNPYAGKRLKLPENIYFKTFLDTSIVSLQNCLTRCSLKSCVKYASLHIEISLS